MIHPEIQDVLEGRTQGCVVCDDCRSALADIPTNSVHTVVTSVPYWGLRDYGVPPSIRGGDPACEHEWQEHIQPAANGINRDGGMTGETLSGNSATRKPKRSSFCVKCGACRGCYGLEPTPELYVEHTVQIFREVRRVLRDDGTLWLNIGDSYNAAGRDSHGTRIGFKQGTNRASQTGDDHFRPSANNLKPKDLVGIPWRVAFALQQDGWYLRMDNIWNKPNPMPESVEDRPTRCHEYVFLLAKNERYFYDLEATKQPCTSGPSDIKKMIQKLDRIDAKHFHVDPGPLPAANPRTNIGNKRGVGDPSGRNMRSVWTIATQPYKQAHFATFPSRLVLPCILAGTSEKGCCPKCMAPWERMTGRPCENCGALIPTQGKSCRQCGHVNDWMAERETSEEYTTIDWSTPGRATPRKLSENGKQAQVGSSHSQTIGWRPTCDCYGRWYTYRWKDERGKWHKEPYWRSGKHPPLRSCVVLDPFGGAGTTGLVSMQEGRAYVLIDLKPEYCRMAKKRINSKQILFAKGA